MFGSTIHSVSYGISDAVAKVKTEPVELENHVCFSATALFPDKLCVFRCFRSPFLAARSTSCRVTFFDVGVEVMSELLHCHAESSIFSMTDISLDKLSVLWKVRGHSKDCLGFLTVVKTSPSLATLLRFHDSPSCLPALWRFVFEPSQSTARRSGVRTVPWIRLKTP